MRSLIFVFQLSDRYIILYYIYNSNFIVLQLEAHSVIFIELVRTIQ